MKKIFLFFSLFLILSCAEKKERNLDVTVVYGTGWNTYYSHISCDSIHTISSKEIDVFIDGVKTKLKTDNIITVRN